MSHDEAASAAADNGADKRNGADDIVLPFSTDRAGAIGRIVKLKTSVNEILTRHEYPDAVAHTLGEALALTAMLGTTLNVTGRLILQASTNGPLKMLVVNFDAPGHMRGYASFDERANEFPSTDFDRGELLGEGHLALTVDPGGDLDRYQGIVALEGKSLTHAALNYFQQSEQLPTFLRLAVAREYTATPDADKNAREPQWHWRASGLMVQHVARQGGTYDPRNTIPAEGNSDTTQIDQDDDNENWERTRLLAQTVEDHELLDAALPADRLLYRLFHEEGVRVTTPVHISARCRCSRDRVEGFVKNFKPDELEGLREPDGALTVTCEFCNTAYRFEPNEF